MNEKNQVFPNNFKTFRKKDIPKKRKRNDSTEIIPKFELKPKAKDKKYYFRKAPSQKKKLTMIIRLTLQHSKLIAPKSQFI